MSETIPPKYSNYWGADHNYFYAVYRHENRTRKSAIIRKKKHKKIISLFHEKIVHAMCDKLYVFKMPFGIGDVFISEELNTRRYIKQLGPPEKKGEKASFKYVPNIGLRKIFRMTWRKESSKIYDSFAYRLSIKKKTAKYMGNYIGNRNEDPEQPNFRSHRYIK